MTLDNAWNTFYCTVAFCERDFVKLKTQTRAFVNNATITISDKGYSPESLTVKAGSQVKLKLINHGGAGCVQSFTIPKLGIQKIVRLGDSDSIDFTAPKEKGQIAFMCSMGMYRGVINVI
jgi:plastocyanin domain-containing protein